MHYDPVSTFFKELAKVPGEENEVFQQSHSREDARQEDEQDHIA